MLRKFNECFRYIADLLTINIDNFMDKWKHKIYPEELTLTCEGKSDQVLDLHLVIRKRVLSYSLFNKRNHFNFPIVNFPNLSGNIPTAQSYRVLWLNLSVRKRLSVC